MKGQRKLKLVSSADLLKSEKHFVLGQVQVFF